jgi:cytochrome c553
MTVPSAKGFDFEGQYTLRDDPGLHTRHTFAMTTRRTPSPAETASGPKLRQTQAEYTAARPNAEPGVRPMMSSSKMYVCIRCHANFKTGDGKPDPRLRGLGRCNTCLGVTAVPTT